ncbi:glycosyhydrolase [Opitutaceae bacterium TAV5]|nr:glycosyhydrolase [Opitutaceae bacterium TAV5]
MFPRCRLFFAFPALCTATVTIGAPTPVALAPFYPESAIISVHAAENKALPLQGVRPSASVSYQINDYSGTVVARGRITAGPDGRLAVPAALPSGYYELLLVAPADASGVAATLPFLRLPPVTSFAGADPFFSFDTALSWLLPPEVRAERIAQLPQVIGTAGLARERLSWNAIHPAPDHRDWETVRQYETTRRDYAANGIKILEMFHDSPAWLGKAQGGKFPLDLSGSARSFTDIALRWQSYWGALEVWNEPNIGFGGNQPADQYLPIVKTIRHTLRSAGVDTPIGGGVFAYLNPDYLSLAARNGLLDESDFISFHYYSDPRRLEKHIGDMRAWLRANDRESKPIWITEIGRRWRGDPKTIPTLAQQREVARYVAMQAIEARACGISAWFPFVYPPYNERELSNFGFTDSHGLPLRPLAAIAQVTRALSGSTYAGDLALPSGTSSPDPAGRIRIFDTQDPEKKLVVICTDEDPADTTMVLPFLVESACGVDGRALATTSTASSTIVPVPDGVAYVVASRAAVTPFIQTATEAMRLSRIARQEPPPLPPASPVILQPLIDLKATGITAVTRGYHLPAGDDVRIPLKLRINNLSGQPRTVSVTYTTQDAASSAPQSAEVAPGAFAELRFDIPASALPRNDDGTFSLTFSASAPDLRIAPASLVFIPSLGLEEYLAEYPWQFALPVNEPQRWRSNANGKLTFAHDSPGAIWGFRVTFGKGDRWAYPRFTLPQEVALDRLTGVLLRARCARPATVRLMSWDADNNMSVTSSAVVPDNGQWHVVYVPLSSWLKPAADGDAPLGRQISDLSLGLNSLADDNAIEVSDFYLLGR